MKTLKGETKILYCGMKTLKGWDEIFRGWDENFKGGGMKSLVPTKQDEHSLSDFLILFI